MYTTQPNLYSHFRLCRDGGVIMAFPVGKMGIGTPPGLGTSIALKIGSSQQQYFSSNSAKGTQS